MGPLDGDNSLDGAGKFKDDVDAKNKAMIQ